MYRWRCSRRCRSGDPVSCTRHELAHSVALIKVLCARHFQMRPRSWPPGPDLAAMVAVADAALLIGEPALLAEFGRHGWRKIDLGAAWKAMTGLPFVYAFWAGLPGVLTRADVGRFSRRVTKAGAIPTRWPRSISRGIRRGRHSEPPTSASTSGHESARANTRRSSGTRARSGNRRARPPPGRSGSTTGRRKVSGGPCPARRCAGARMMAMHRRGLMNA